MTSNLFSAPDRRPDQAQWTRMNVGFASPLWIPFLMAAGAGAAWWTYANWSKLASPWTGDLQKLGAEGGAAPAAPEQPAKSALNQNLAVQGAADAPTAAAELDDGSDVIDAAYAANLGPVPPPKRAGAKRASAETAAKKTTAKQTAGKAAGKRAAAERPARKAKR